MTAGAILIEVKGRVRALVGASIDGAQTGDYGPLRRAIAEWNREMSRHAPAVQIEALSEAIGVLAADLGAAVGALAGAGGGDMSRVWAAVQALSDNAAAVLTPDADAQRSAGRAAERRDLGSTGDGGHQVKPMIPGA